MERHILLIAACCAIGTAQAQLQINPQVGATFQNITGDERNVEYKANGGFQLGCDFRAGDRLYFQPGAFFTRSSTLVKYTYSDTAVVEDDLVRTTLKFKVLFGANLINGGKAKLRGNIGPTYDILMSVDNTDDEIDWNKDDFQSGSFNMDAGLGVDVWFVTAEAGVSYGLSNTYKDSGLVSGDSKYFTWYFNVGIVLGNGKPK